jgi:hypothetical protein
MKLNMRYLLAAITSMNAAAGSRSTEVQGGYLAYPRLSLRHRLLYP